MTSRIRSKGISSVIALALALIPFLAPLPVFASSCSSLSFSGKLATLQAPLTHFGSWTLSGTCAITGSSPGITIGTFTGSFSSTLVSGPVTGTWSIVGTTQKVMAMGTGTSGVPFRLSISLAIPPLPAPGLTFQGTLQTIGSAPILLVETSGSISFTP